MDERSSSDGILRRWDLNSNSTRHDRIRAAPSDHDLRLMWSIWLVILFLMSCLTFALLMGMLTAPPKVRKNAFNTYLFYLVIPDFVFSFCCFVTCFWCAIVGHFVSEWMCQFQHFYLVFGIGANCWLNALVALQLYRLLRKSRFPDFRRQYKAPSHKDARRHAMWVYLYVMFLASLFYIPIKKDPLAIISHKGMYCFPGEASRTSSFAFWFLFIPLLILIPLGVVLWTSFQVIWYQMLPKTGRRRALTLFFTRLIFIFILMWIPALSFVFVGGAWSTPWIAMAGGTWSHMQSAASAIAAMSKDDIRRAVLDLICCRSREEPKETYRVAVQSVSAVLENDDSSAQDDNAGEKKQSIPDPTAKHSESHRQEGDDLEQAQNTLPQTFGSPQAHWPSQRPMRVNPRLAQYYREQQDQEHAQKRADALKRAASTLSSTSSTTVQNDTRSVAKHVLRVLQNDYDDNQSDSD